MFKVSITTVAELSIGIDECKLITSENACILSWIICKVLALFVNNVEVFTQCSVLFKISCIIFTRYLDVP